MQKQNFFCFCPKLKRNWNLQKITFLSFGWLKNSTEKPKFQNPLLSILYCSFSSTISTIAYADCLYARIIINLYIAITKHCAFQVHRLDRDSSGILVMGRTQTSATALHSIFREKTFGAKDVSSHLFPVFWKPKCIWEVDSHQLVTIQLDCIS